MSFLELVLFLACKGRREKALRSDNVGANAWLYSLLSDHTVPHTEDTVSHFIRKVKGLLV